MFNLLIVVGACLTLCGCRRNFWFTGNEQVKVQSLNTSNIFPTNLQSQLSQLSVTNRIINTNAPLPIIRVDALQFPPNATNYHNWDVLESHDLIHWYVCEKNIYWINHIMFPTSSTSFYKVEGRL